MRHSHNTFCFVLVCLLLYGLSVPVSSRAVTLDRMELVRASLDYQLHQTDGQATTRTVSDRFYADRDYRPVWLTRNGVRPEGYLLLEQLKDCRSHGLSSERYAVSRIQKLIDQREIASLTTLELLLTQNYYRYSLDLQAGRTAPGEMDPRQKTIHTATDPLKDLARSLEDGTFFSALNRSFPQGSGYQKLRQALETYRQLQTKGSWPSVATDGKILAYGDTHPAIPQLRIRLALTNDYQTPFTHTDLFDQPLVTALKHFQARHGLQSSGRLDTKTLDALNVPINRRIEQIQANLERLRWGPRRLESYYVLVNMADFRLNVIDQNRQALSMKVIVGKPYRSTPAFSQKLTHLVVNPYWYVPRSIAVHDILPRVRRDPGYLARQKFQVFQTTGTETTRIDPAKVDWSALRSDRFDFSFRQDPGPGNALGRIKFILPNPYSVFLHDTPQQGLFNREARTYSSGCVRLEKPFELARYLLKRETHGRGDFLDKTLSSQTPQVIKLEEATPVHLVYWTVWVDQSDALQFRDDVYDRNRKLRLAFRS